MCTIYQRATYVAIFHAHGGAPKLEERLALKAITLTRDWSARVTMCDCWKHVMTETCMTRLYIQCSEKLRLVRSCLQWGQLK